MAGEGRWAGLRRFLAGSRAVFYGYWAEEATTYIETIEAGKRPTK